MPKPFPTPERVLVVCAHPDDPEFSAAGTIAKWSQTGARVTYIIVTDGSKGTSDPNMTSEELVKIREQEQRAAAEVLGVAEVVFLGYEDSGIVNNQALRRDIVQQIRLHRPDVLITHDPTARIMDNRSLNHTDHRTVGDTTLDAVYPLARDRLNFPEHEVEGLEPHKVLDIFLVSTNEPNFLVDITDTIDLKLAALRAHKSQIQEPEKVEEYLRKRNEKYAEGSSFTYGEWFRRVVLWR